MIRETYESPKMTFEEVKVNETVANTCWGHHSSGKRLYCDINGSGGGFMSFQIQNGSCDLNLTSVLYHSNKADKTGSPVINDPNDEKDMYDNLYNFLVDKGGNNGEPFKGENVIVFEDISNPKLS